MGRVGSDPRGSLSNPLRHGAGPGRGSSPWDSPADPPRKQTGRRGSSRVTRGAGRVPGHRNSRLSLAAGKNHLRPSHQDRAHDYYPLHIKGIHITKQNICPITADASRLFIATLSLVGQFIKHPSTHKTTWLILAPSDLLISSLPKAQSLKCCQQLGCPMFLTTR
ncbi:hypothetical protein PSHT_00292 [Puccinia striiformis]|uniref:Uncharacterized protein n=3 Tax=Puccinia striiformis TaxID=27350 RepID=A0A2S4UQL2_9BASI|nr:hypothetical protein PSTT_13668 [Puccinia striiformis]POW23300.1 hypothetical protein PSHT_00292 [Puccinia striiformis]